MSRMNGSDRFIEAVNSGKSLKLNGSGLNYVIIILQWGTVKVFSYWILQDFGRNRPDSMRNPGFFINLPA